MQWCIHVWLCFEDIDYDDNDVVDDDVDIIYLDII